MRILIIDTYYQHFLNTFWEKNNSLKKSKYSTQLRTILDQKFGTSDYYSKNLNSLGHETVDIIANDKYLQTQWANEHNIKLQNQGLIERIKSLPYLYKFLGKPNWIQTIIFEQTKFYRPNVVYMQDLSVLNPSVLKEIKKNVKLLVGQIASPLPEDKYLNCYDLILTSFPHYVDKLRKTGIKSEYFKIGFEHTVSKLFENRDRIYNVVFIGSFSPYHQEGTKTLEKVATEIPIHVWGNGINFLSPNSPLRKYYHGEAWGKDMYRILSQSKIVINRHIKVAQNYANNMRMYETTGMGAMLITDHKENLNDLFTVGKEVISYSNTSDLIKKIRYYLSHDAERAKIAKAGQNKTLKDHTYKQRMKELLKILKKYL